MSAARRPKSRAMLVMVSPGATTCQTAAAAAGRPGRTHAGTTRTTIRNARSLLSTVTDRTNGLSASQTKRETDTEISGQGYGYGVERHLDGGAGRQRRHERAGHLRDDQRLADRHGDAAGRA